MEEDDEMRIIFLDVDGVLNSINTKEYSPGKYIGISDKHVEVLKKILEKSQKVEETKIVLSSSWRAGIDKNGNRLSNQDYEYLLDKLKNQGIFLYDETPIFPNGWNRGQEILSWLSSHKDLFITGMLVLDDERHDFKETGVSKFWLQTTYYGSNGGLNEKHLKWAPKIFEKPIPFEFFTYSDPEKDDGMELD